jgi:hypothetical protein
VRESTSIVYDAKWTIFSDWCVGREIDPFKISVQQSMNFASFPAQSKCQLETAFVREEFQVYLFCWLKGIPDKGAEPIYIPALPQDSDSVSLCPVRILSIYLTRTVSLRSSTNKRLFIIDSLSRHYRQYIVRLNRHRSQMMR